MESPQPETNNTSDADDIETEDLLTNDFHIIDETKDDSTEIEDEQENENEISVKHEKVENISPKNVNEKKENTDNVEKYSTDIPVVNIKEEFDLTNVNDGKVININDDVKLTQKIPLIILTNIDDATKKDKEGKPNEKREIKSEKIVNLTSETTLPPNAGTNEQTNDNQQNKEKLKSADSTKKEDNTKEVKKTVSETKTDKDKKPIPADNNKSPMLKRTEERLKKKRIACKIRFLRKIILSNWMSNVEKYRVFKNLMDKWNSNKSDTNLKYKIKIKYLTNERTIQEIKQNEARESRESSLEAPAIENMNKDTANKPTDSKNLKNKIDKDKTDKDKNDTDKDVKLKDNKTQKEDQTNKRKVDDKNSNDSKSKKPKSDKVRNESEKKLEPVSKRPNISNKGPIKTLEEIRKERSKYNPRSSRLKSDSRDRRSNSKSYTLYERNKQRVENLNRNKPPISNVSKYNRNLSSSSINKNPASKIPAVFNNTPSLVPLPTLQQQLSQAIMNNVLQNYVQNVNQPIINQPIVQQPIYQQPVSSKPVPLMQQLIVKPTQTNIYNREEPKISNINPWESSPKELEPKQDWDTDDSLFSRRRDPDRFETDNQPRKSFGNRSPDRDIYSARDSIQRPNIYPSDNTSRDRSTEIMDALKRKVPRFSRFSREDSPKRDIPRTLQISKSDPRNPDRFNSRNKDTRNDLFSTNENIRERSPQRSNMFSRERSPERNIFMHRQDTIMPRKNSMSPDRLNIFSNSDKNSRSHTFTDKEPWNNATQESTNTGFFSYTKPEDNIQKSSQPTMNYQSNQLNKYYGQPTYMYQTPQNVQTTNLQFNNMSTTKNNFSFSSGSQMPFFNYSSLPTTQANTMQNYYSTITPSNSNKTFNSMKPSQMSNNKNNKNNQRDNEFTSAFELERNRRLMNK